MFLTHGVRGWRIRASNNFQSELRIFNQRITVRSQFAHKKVSGIRLKAASLISVDMITKRRLSVLLPCAAFGLLSVVGLAQLNRERGNGPDDIPQLTFFSHRVGTDHAEGITVI